MKRSIISVDEDKCNGCGQCIPNCPEGALQIIDGKARLVSDLFCDGLGACLGNCPTGAMTIEEREAEEYDEYKVMANVVKGGKNVIKAHLKHLEDHNQDEFYNQAVDYLNENKIGIPDINEPDKQFHAHSGGCPGSRMMDLRQNKQEESVNINQSSELRQWPIQLQLLNPHAPYFKNADLLIAADCVPAAYPNFHKRFLKDKIMIMFCPKLDQTIEQYVEKLAEIFKNQDINSITIVHMEVPCCFGIERAVTEALKRSEKNIIIKDYTISISGEVI